MKDRLEVLGAGTMCSSSCCMLLVTYIFVYFRLLLNMLSLDIFGSDRVCAIHL